jgi:hypothetical protein
MICGFYRWLYQALPIIPWQTLLMRIHLARCSNCEASYAPRNNDSPDPKSIGVTADNVTLPHNLWHKIQSQLPSDPIHNKTLQLKIPRTNTWKWVSAAAAIGIIFLLLFPFGLLKHATYPNGKQVMVQSHEIVIHTVKVANRPAHTVYFQSSNNDRIIVFVK